MKKIIPILIMATIITGCTSYQYVASPQYVPLNEKKGELKAALAFNSYFIGYSITNRFSVFSTGYCRKVESNFELLINKENSGAHSRKENSNIINLGAGYFNKTNNINYEVMIGTGLGHTDYECERDWLVNYQFSMKGKKYNLFVQPDLGYKVNDYVEFGVFSKFNYFRFFDLNTSTIIGDNPGIEQEDSYFSGKNKANLFFIEPGLFFKGGFPEAKINLLLSPVMNILDYKIRYRELNLRLSVFLSFDLFKNKKKVNNKAN